MFVCEQFNIEVSSNVFRHSNHCHKFHGLVNWILNQRTIWYYGINGSILKLKIGVKPINDY